MFIVRDESDCCEALANAIILQAVKDYRKALKRDDCGRQKEIERFFRSEWFSVLTKVNPEILIQKLAEEVYMK